MARKTQRANVFEPAATSTFNNRDDVVNFPEGTTKPFLSESQGCEPHSTNIRTQGLQFFANRVSVHLAVEADALVAFVGVGAEIRAGITQLPFMNAPVAAETKAPKRHFLPAPSALISSLRTLF